MTHAKPSRCGPKAESCNQLSVRALHARLAASTERAAGRDPRIVQGCSSQTALAHLDVPDLGIRPMSLNTLKTVCERVVTGGFGELDRLRRLLARAPQKAADPASTERSAASQQRPQDEPSGLRDQRQKLVDSCAFMADQYNDLLGLYRRTLDRAENGRIDPVNERRLLEGHLARFRGSKAQPLTVIEGNRREPGDER